MSMTNIAESSSYSVWCSLWCSVANYDWKLIDWNTIIMTQIDPSMAKIMWFSLMYKYVVDDARIVSYLLSFSKYQIHCFLTLAKQLLLNFILRKLISIISKVGIFWMFFPLSPKCSISVGSTLNYTSLITSLTHIFCINLERSNIYHIRVHRHFCFISFMHPLKAKNLLNSIGGVQSKITAMN